MNTMVIVHERTVLNNKLFSFSFFAHLDSYHIKSEEEKEKGDKKIVQIGDG